MYKWLVYWKTRLSHPIQGIKNGIMYDSAIKIEVMVGTVVLVGLHFIFGPFAALEQLLLIFCFFLMVMAEFFNSSIETALSHLHPDRHDEIGLSKDLASGDVMCTGIFSLICLYYVLSGSLSV